jgi:stringent starvation protein B
MSVNAITDLSFNNGSVYFNTKFSGVHVNVSFSYKSIIHLNPYYKVPISKLTHEQYKLGIMVTSMVDNLARIISSLETVQPLTPSQYTVDSTDAPTSWNIKKLDCPYVRKPTGDSDPTPPRPKSGKPTLTIIK